MPFSGAERTIHRHRSRNLTDFLASLVTVSFLVGAASASFHQHQQKQHITHRYRFRLRGRSTVNLVNFHNPAVQHVQRTGGSPRIAFAPVPPNSIGAGGCVDTTALRECLIDVNSYNARARHENSGIYETYSCYTRNARDYEVHVLSVYEPPTGRRAYMAAPSVVGKIHVNINRDRNAIYRPLKLVLTSYEAANWIINATGVHIDEIVLLSYYDVHSRVSVTGNTGSYIFRRYKKYDGYGRRPYRRRNLFLFINKHLSFITSFTGTYITRSWNLTVGVPKSCDGKVDYRLYCLSKRVGFHRDPADCGYYVICQLPKYARLPCAKGTRWNDVMKQCQSADKVPCLSSQTETSITTLPSINTEEECLHSKRCWLKYKFRFDPSWTSCHGDQYVRRSGYISAMYVGVILCDNSSYKILLSNSLKGEFKNVADGSGHGQDHCEFVGGREGDANLPNDFWDSPLAIGYYRSRWGEAPKIGLVGFGPKDGSNWTGRYYVKKYRCGVKIPGDWSVVSSRPLTVPITTTTTTSLPSLEDGASSGDGEDKLWQRAPLQPGSRLEFRNIPNYSHISTKFSTEFKTTGSSGLMFYIADAKHIDFIGLYMHNGKLALSFNCGSGLATLKTGAKYNDGRWHRVEFVRDMEKGSLEIDNIERVTGLTPGGARSIKVEPPFYVGGVANSVATTASHNIPKDVASSFPGCMKRFKLNEKGLGMPSSEFHSKHCLRVPNNQNKPSNDSSGHFNDAPVRTTRMTTQPPPSTPDTRPPFYFTRRPTNQTKRLGDFVLLQCKTNMKAKVSWIRDGKPVNDLSVLGNGVLMISKLTKKHIGKYACQAKNQKDGRVIKSEAWIKIYKATCTLKFEKKPQNETVNENYHHVFSCDVQNADSIRWEKNGEPIQVAHGARVDKLVNGYLLINKVRWFDRGQYTCIANKDSEQCEVTASAWLDVKREVDISDMCGKPVVAHPSDRSPEVRRGYIVGGRDAKKGSAPWHVMLYDDEWVGTFCGAVLVSRQWVITAAHCFLEFSEQYDRKLTVDSLKVKLGKYDKEHKERQEVVVKASQFIIHPDFNHALYDNDIALIKLEKEVVFTDYVIPICLQDAAFVQRHFINPGGFGSVTGWGALTASPGATSPRYLNEIRLPLVEKETCGASTNYTVTDNMFCAGYAREIVGDACDGDSGGPFIMKHDGKWILVGLVSWGEECAKEGKYGFYTHVANYYDWILSYISD